MCIVSICSLSCHGPGFRCPIRVLCCLCFCFQLMWSRSPPASLCCLSSSGIRLIISMCSHSIYRYTQGSGHLSIKGNLFERSCPLSHKHIHLEHWYYFFFPCHASLACLLNCWIPMCTKRNLRVHLCLAGEQRNKERSDNYISFFLKSQRCWLPGL